MELFFWDARRRFCSFMHSQSAPAEKSEPRAGVTGAKLAKPIRGMST
jgi:hypothetical protein